MTDPTVLTGYVLAFAAAATVIFQVVYERRRARRSAERAAAAAAAADAEKAAGTVGNWQALYQALSAEIERVRADRENDRASYERQLRAANGRITELQGEVDALRRALRGGAAP